MGPADKLVREMFTSTGTEVQSVVHVVRQAVTAYLDDKQQQSLSPNWERKLKRELLYLANWCDANVILSLQELNLHALENYRKTWTGARITRRKRQERLRSFFQYCTRHNWTTDTPATDLSAIKAVGRLRRR